MFKPDDRVRVVDPMKHLPRGEYTVDYISEGFLYLKGNGIGDFVTGGWLPSRFELVKEQDMPKNYPTDLKVGDVLHTNTGRTYTVTDYDSTNGQVSYAYIPWNSKDNTIVIDTKDVSDLHWVARVTNAKGYKVWEASRPATVGDMVEYGGRKWEVTHDNKGYLTLRRSVTDVSADKVRVV